MKQFMYRHHRLLIFLFAILLVSCGQIGLGSAIRPKQVAEQDCWRVFKNDVLLLEDGCEGVTPEPTAEVTEIPETFTPVPSPTTQATATQRVRPTATGAATATIGAPTSIPSPTAAVTATAVATPTPGATATQPPEGEIEPFVEAPLCPDSGDEHDTSIFHTLWDSVRGCHYDHEHGTTPFTDEVAGAFPDFDLFSLLGNVHVGHTNPSAPTENVLKHGGMFWSVDLDREAGCDGREGLPTGVDAHVVQAHGFGDYSIEFETRFHSAVGLLRQCRSGNPTDYGYIYVVTLQDYGQRTSPYQGTVLPYPDTPLPEYPSPREPYFTIDCFGGSTPPCDRYPTLAFVINNQVDANTTWIGEPVHVAGNEVFSVLFRARDTYQMLDASDLIYPFTFRWLCTNDGGLTYDGENCRYNNTTTIVHEIHGEIPFAWDGLAGFDTDPRQGRVTGEGFISAFGDLVLECEDAGGACHPIKLVSAFTGSYGSGFRGGGETVFHPSNLPERDVYFCGNEVCGEFDNGARPSGWVGQSN